VDAAVAVDERLLVLRALQSPEAFEPLLSRYFTAVNNYCFYCLGDQTEAEDATSSIFAKAYFALGSFNAQKGTFHSWLFRIARNEVIDRKRYRSRHQVWPIDWLRNRASADHSPEELVIEADARMRVHSLLSTLPKREREVLELRTDRLETDQIAALLGVTEQNVRSIQCRAYRRIRDLLAQTGTSGSEVPGD
jgi:RNA polymerase sigma-70 factor (ECF subfamily)